MVTFTACRSKPELVVPARVMPREVRYLSDVDNHPPNRVYSTSVAFYRRLVVPEGGAPERPASFLKAGLAKALVHYYPIAGRLRELPGSGGGGKKKKLVVDCTAEGAVFVEAYADVRLEDFGKPLVPPYPCVDELTCNVGDVTSVLGKPLLYLQMTKLRCGGLVLALTMCLSVVDAFGMAQILRCILDLALGQDVPTVPPSWDRHLLVCSRECGDVAEMAMLAPLQEMVIRSFLFGPREIAVLRSRDPRPLRRSSSSSSSVFELITAAVWRCRVAALEYAAHKRVRIVFTLNARGSWKRDPPLPPGFYGNATFVAAAEASAGELCRSPLAHALNLVREARLKATDEHVQSVLDLMARGEYHVDVLDGTTFVVSDMTKCGDDDDSLHIGSWAERVGGGPTMPRGNMAAIWSNYVNCKGTGGEWCVAVPMVLPEPAMGRFTSQIAQLTNMFATSAM